MEKHLLEILSDPEYNNFISAMTRLCQLPYSYREKAFINQFRKPLLIKTDSDQIPKPQFDENGKSFITIYGEYNKKVILLSMTIQIYL